jgi:hypothetical protein
MTLQVNLETSNSSWFGAKILCFFAFNSLSLLFFSLFFSLFLSEGKQFKQPTLTVTLLSPFSLYLSLYLYLCARVLVHTKTQVVILILAHDITTTDDNDNDNDDDDDDDDDDEAHIWSVSTRKKHGASFDYKDQ